MQRIFDQLKRIEKTFTPAEDERPSILPNVREGQGIGRAHRIARKHDTAVCNLFFIVLRHLRLIGRRRSLALMIEVFDFSRPMPLHRNRLSARPGR